MQTGPLEIRDEVRDSDIIIIMKTSSGPLCNNEGFEQYF